MSTVAPQSSVSCEAGRGRGGWPHSLRLPGFTAVIDNVAVFKERIQPPCRVLALPAAQFPRFGAPLRRVARVERYRTKAGTFRRPRCLPGRGGSANRVGPTSVRSELSPASPWPLSMKNTSSVVLLLGVGVHDLRPCLDSRPPARPSPSRGSHRERRCRDFQSVTLVSAVISPPSTGDSLCLVVGLLGWGPSPVSCRHGGGACFHPHE